MTTYVVPGVPVAKPRMTQRDKWLARASVLNYWDWKARAQRVCSPRVASGISATFYFPLPKRPRIKPGTPHRVKPDIDNALKAVLDAVVIKDQGIWEVGRLAKYYDDGQGPRVEFSIW